MLKHKELRGHALKEGCMQPLYGVSDVMGVGCLTLAARDEKTSMSSFIVFVCILQCK